MARLLIAALIGALSFLPFPATARNGLFLFSGGAAGPPPAYAGFADVVTGGSASWGAAWGLDRSPISSYIGPLFAIWDGSTLTNIPQTAGHVIDAAVLATKLATCGTPTTSGGISTYPNCYFGKFYDATGNSNNLVPFTGYSCGGPYACAQHIQIETATGYPVLKGGNDGTSYWLPSDADASGIAGGSNALSVVMNTQTQNQSICCGGFGMARLYTLPIGDDIYDFSIGFGYGTSANDHCNTGTSHCIGIDGGPYVRGDLGTSIGNYVAIIAHDPVSATTFGWTNNTQTIPPTSDVGKIIDLKLHWCAGGDMTQPGPCFIREGGVLNITASSGDAAALQANMAAFYSTLTYP